LLILAGVGLLPFVVLEVVYRIGLTYVDELPHPAIRKLLPSDRGVWAEVERAAPMRTQPLWPWTFVRDLRQFVRAPPPGMRLADQIARKSLANARHAGLARFSLTIWLTRTWSTEAMVIWYADHTFECRR
jgi:hypothetical protein